MAKYRLLSQDELKLFEKEFIEFLVVNGIEADTWKELKEVDLSKANQIMDLFSDVVFEQVLKQVSYLEKSDAAVLQFVRCGNENMELVAIKRKSSEINLVETPLSQVKFEEVELIKGSKSYQDLRELEIFNMIVQGYSPSKGEAWNSLEEQLSH